jgi:hypothetical protein
MVVSISVGVFTVPGYVTAGPYRGYAGATSWIKSEFWS